MRIKHYLYNAFTISEGKTESKEVYLAGLKPDVLMIPNGGGKVPNTMDTDEAIQAVRDISQYDFIDLY